MGVGHDGQQALFVTEELQILFRFKIRLDLGEALILRLIWFVLGRSDFQVVQIDDNVSVGPAAHGKRPLLVEAEFVLIFRF